MFFGSGTVTDLVSSSALFVEARRISLCSGLIKCESKAFCPSVWSRYKVLWVVL